MSEHDNRLKQVFNTDLSHVQQYLFHKLRLNQQVKYKVNMMTLDHEYIRTIEDLVSNNRLRVREERNRGKQKNMNEDELAFYDALGVNDSTVRILGDETLRKIALELTQMIRSSVTIDWTQRESVQAEIRLKVKKILRRHGYHPDRKKKATAVS